MREVKLSSWHMVWFHHFPVQYMLKHLYLGVCSVLTLIGLELSTVYVHSLIPRPSPSSAFGCFNTWHHYMWWYLRGLHHTIVVMLDRYVIYTLQVYRTQQDSPRNVSLSDPWTRHYKKSFKMLCWVPPNFMSQVTKSPEFSYLLSPTWLHVTSDEVTWIFILEVEKAREHRLQATSDWKLTLKNTSQNWDEVSINHYCDHRGWHQCDYWQWNSNLSEQTSLFVIEHRCRK